MGVECAALMGPPEALSVTSELSSPYIKAHKSVSWVVYMSWPPPTRGIIGSFVTSLLRAPTMPQGVSPQIRPERILTASYRARCLFAQEFCLAIHGTTALEGAQGRQEDYFVYSLFTGQAKEVFRGGNVVFLNVFP